MSLPIYVIGHKNPDTDSICAALALAELKRQTGVNAVAARLGTLNPETKFILDKLHFPNKENFPFLDPLPSLFLIGKSPFLVPFYRIYE